MTIHKQETISYHYGAERNIYLFPPLNSCDDLKKFMISLESICGEIWDIIVKKDIGENTVRLYGKYEFLLDFLEKFDLQNIQEFDTYEFSGRNSDSIYYTHCKIDTVKNTLDIYKSNHASKPEKGSYKYYRFENGIIVRLNTNGSGCHYLTDDNRWKLDYSYEDLIDDAAYKYAEISDPLNGMADEYERRYAENAAKRMEYYKQFAYEIKIAES